MKITDSKTFVVGNPAPSLGGRYWVFVKLVTDSNVVGYGEAYSLPFHPNVVVKMINDVCARHVIDANPFRIEQLWRIIFSAGYNQRSGNALMGVLSAIEMACWDIVGKELDRPIYDLLGGRVRERIRSYTYLYPREGDTKDVYTDSDLAAQRAAEYVARGFTAVKFDPVGPYTAYDPRQLSRAMLSRSETFCRKIREAVGDRADILFGTHGQMTASGAIRLAKVLEPYDPLWFEEPVPPENENEMAKVARAIPIPVATGERLASKYEFQRVLAAGAAAILQPNLGRVGGILEAKKIAGMAEANYLQIAPHLYCGPIVGAAAIQLGACSPNLLIQEGILDWGGFHADILRRPIDWEEGYILLPTAPGLGVELDERVAEAHPYIDTKLHLTTEEKELEV
jgi:2-dehydro-3-deoxyphosphogalactonate aldolase